MIDKGYLMGYAVEHGKIVVNSNLYSGGYNYTLNDCFNLVNPTGQPCTYNQSITENTYFLTPKDLAVFTQELTSRRDHPSTIELFNKIIRSGATNVVLDDKALSLAKENRAIAEEIAKQIDKHNTTQLSPDMLDLAIKNKTLFKILQVTDDIENLPIASTSVDTVTKEPKGIANKTDAAEEKKILCYDNPASIFEMQITNMVGKEVIGIAAVSLKSFFAESAYYNQLVTEIEDIVKQNPYDSTKNDLLVKKLNQLLIPNALEGGYCSLLANVNYNDLYELLQERDILLSEGEVALDKIPHVFYNPLTGGTIDWLPNENGMYSVKNLIQIYKFIADVNDACYGDSGLLSLSTDGQYCQCKTP